ncbi:C1 family peptidase [Rhizobium sp. L1K21]|uniref:C1 family peptidase n=1 Tax=Rhizobium sp. L1K21 TaxID=2954933 RepID=UPI002091E8EF|nr:C1 family peptidase [Rhizobium sp. L1K21]MCO6188287.1 C1 family peptidase [Rhizobium sp. L1K21]
MAIRSVENLGSDKTITTSDSTRVLNAHGDFPDIRDRMYEPALLELLMKMDPPAPQDSPILDQGTEGACTGFALAGAINLLRRRASVRQNLPTPEHNVSPRMLYEMAKLHDEWPGNDYDGSSIRGAIKGFFHNGVCSDTLAPYDPNTKNWTLAVAQAKDARNIGLGAYYRLRPQIIDYHAALNEVGAIVVSASVHRGWSKPKKGIIQRSNFTEGGHAFMIVGYDSEGFLIQNSWGLSWGGFQQCPGIAHWSYEDWAENVMDAWALRLAVPTPKSFDLTHTGANIDSATSAKITLPAPRRLDILGHFVHVDDGQFVEKGTYATSFENISETAKYLAADGQKDAPKYDHLMIYAHGGLNSSNASARRIKAMKEIFKRNRIYPFHFMWETGFNEELGDIFKEAFSKSEARVGFSFGELNDLLFEQLAGGLGKRIWRQMKFDAERAFAKNAAGLRSLKEILAQNQKRKKPLAIHCVGHSAGSILLGEMLKNWKSIAASDDRIESLSLMAPACTLDFFKAAYLPRLKGGASADIKSLWQYNLIDSRELDDTVGTYGKSLLYLVSNAFEESKHEPLLGMEKFCDGLPSSATHKIFFAGRDSSRTDSKVHGGFDNDRATMNDVLAHILGKKPKPSLAFQEHEMSGY